MSWLFFLLEFALVSLALLGAFALRSRLGLGPVVAVVASLQFLQSILGSSLYWPVGEHVLVNPGSCILFAGNLAIMLYAYARDGAIAARVILYGVIIANLLNVGMNLVFAGHIAAVAPVWVRGDEADLFHRGIVPSLVGVALLYVDQVLALLAMASLRRRFPRAPAWLTLPAVLAGTLMFDTVGYVGLLMFREPDFGWLMLSGLVTKGLGGLLFGVVWGAVLTHEQHTHEHTLNDLVGLLLFRENLDTLRRAVVTDELTGLYNRRSYGLVAARIVERASAAEPCCLLLIDADHFKQVNDQLGHARGDEVIVEIANHVAHCTRDDDFCFRLGGDEFAVVLPRCDRDNAREVAVRIGAYEFRDPAIELPVTLTMGLAEFPHDAPNLDALFEVADRRLYEGKELGRHQIVSQNH